MCYQLITVGNQPPRNVRGFSAAQRFAMIRQNPTWLSSTGADWQIQHPRLA